MKATILIAVLNSHEILRRQLLHFEKIGLPEDVSLMIIDDGSVPELSLNGCGLSNVKIHATNNYDPWTQPLARNLGAELADGEYLICTDIDHILTRDAIDLICETEYDVVRFKRYAGALDVNGNFTQDRDVLESYGFNRNRGLRMAAHGNSYAIKRDLFLKLGGSQQRDVYPNRDEVPLKRALKQLQNAGLVKIIPDDERPSIYMIPNGRYCYDGMDHNYNPFGFFHELRRE